MESWNYGYGDIGGSFGGKSRGTALRAAVATAAKTLKLDDIASSGLHVSLRHVYVCVLRDVHVHIR